MADRLTRIAIVSSDRCKPKKCRQECKKSCPVVKTGISFLMSLTGYYKFMIMIDSVILDASVLFVLFLFFLLFTMGDHVTVVRNYMLASSIITISWNCITILKL